jgi:ribosomal protein L37AE/L43A
MALMIEREETNQAAELPPHRIEAARSSRSKCRTCRRKIDKGVLRLGILLEGPYGTGYLWHHLKCAAAQKPDDLAAAYEAEAWGEGLKVPPLAEMQRLRVAAEKRKSERKTPPWAERAKTGRSKCKRCGEVIAKGSWRVILAREVDVFGQARRANVNIHPQCVTAELWSPECALESETFEADLRANSRGLEESDLSEVLQAIGPVD